MRDLLILALGIALAIAALRRPLYGALGWVLFSVMNPHRLTYGFAYSFPFAQMMVIVTLMGLMLSKDQRKNKGGAAAVVLALLICWTVLTTAFAFHPTAAQAYLERTAKSFGMAFVLLWLVNSRRDVVMLISVLALSLGFYGAKGGVFVLATGGSHMVNGPPDSVMDGNNALGVGLTMCIPLIFFLVNQTRHKWLRPALIAVMVLCAIAVLGTYSRGALLAIAAMGALLWLRSRRKLPVALVVVAFLTVAIPNMPAKWTDRMNTMQGSAEEDSSAMGRIYAWRTATNIALDKFPLAGGFEWNGLDTSAIYSPVADSALVAHSIYFQTLGSQGFIGLVLFLSFWLLVWLQCAWLRKQCKSNPDRLWAHQLASMVQVSLVGYAVGGAFLDLAFWDLPYYLYAAVAGTCYCIRRDMAAPAPSANAVGDTARAMPGLATLGQSPLTKSAGL